MKYYYSSSRKINTNYEILLYNHIMFLFLMTAIKDRSVPPVYSSQSTQKMHRKVFTTQLYKWGYFKITDHMPNLQIFIFFYLGMKSILDKNWRIGVLQKCRATLIWLWYEMKYISKKKQQTVVQVKKSWKKTWSL